MQFNRLVHSVNKNIVGVVILPIIHGSVPLVYVSCPFFLTVFSLRLAAVHTVSGCAKATQICIEVAHFTCNLFNRYSAVEECLCRHSGHDYHRRYCLTWFSLKAV